jgi:CheY-like chemotaxis protein
MLVDDDADALTSLENVLRHHGAEVLRAASADQAMRILEAHQPGVIVSDLSMPERDGLDLIRAVRQLAGPAGDVPAILLSAHVASEHRANASAAGFQLYIEKPVRPEVFVGHIATLAGLH